MRTISRHTRSTPQIRLTTKDAGAARPQALTISVKALSRYRMCGQELPLPNKYSLLRNLSWAKKRESQPGLVLPTFEQKSWQRQRVRITQVKTREKPEQVERY